METKGSDEMKKVLMIACSAVWLVLALVGIVKAECAVGPVLVNSVESYEIADQYDCIEGELSVAGGNWHVQDLVFHNLQTITGMITIVGRRPPGDWQIAFPVLQEASIIKISSNRRLTSIQFGFDAESIYNLDVYSNGNLLMLLLGSMETIGRDLLVHDNNALMIVQGMSVESVGRDLEIYKNRSLPQCDAEAWFDVPAEGYEIESNKVCQ
jgi:hypothetical protein